MAKSKYPDYSQAEVIARDLQLNSRQAYIDWHKETQCSYLPRYPERAYDKDWVSWNQWLGTANVFKGNIDRPVREMWAAVKWAQQCATDNGLKTMREWLDWCRVNTLPDDIPMRPDTRYTEWDVVGWRGWLGTNVKGRVTAAINATVWFAICQVNNPMVPRNHFVVIICDGGEVELRGVLDRAVQLTAVRIYMCTADQKERLHELLSTHGRSIDDSWQINNIHDMFYDCDLEFIRWTGRVIRDVNPVEVRLEHTQNGAHWVTVSSKDSGDDY